MGNFFNQLDSHLSNQRNPLRAQENTKIRQDKQSPEMVDTIIGRMPNKSQHEIMQQFNNPEMIKEVVGWAAGAPGMKVAAETAPLAKAGITKAWDYIHPEKAAEEFRSSFGEGTSSDNIQVLGKRVQMAKQSAKEDALIPKRELYQQEGKSDVYNMKPEATPEGNLPKIGEMIEPGGQFTNSQMDALSKALKGYRKSGNIESFLDQGEEIFNIPEIPEKAAQKIEETLLMPVKRESSYFSEKGVADFYGKKGLKTLHDTFQKKPTLNNYDELQSAIKKNIRKLSKRDKAGTLDSVGEEKLDSLKTNVKNLDADKESFMKTLPDKMQNLENEFRTKYATNVGPYEAAPLAIRKLAEGKSSEVTPASIGKAFTRMTPETKKILQDLGPSAGKNIIYNALQRVLPGDAGEMAKTILDLKRTKGYDQFISPDMEEWATKMQKQVSRAGLIKNALKISAGATTGGLVGGPTGAAIGAVLPFAKEGALKIAKKLKR